MLVETAKLLANIKGSVSVKANNLTGANFVERTSFKNGLTKPGLSVNSNLPST